MVLYNRRKEFSDAEQGPGVRPPLALLQLPLKGQKRCALHEKDGEGRQTETAMGMLPLRPLRGSGNAVKPPSGPTKATPKSPSPARIMFPLIWEFPHAKKSPRRSFRIAGSSAHQKLRWLFRYPRSEPYFMTWLWHQINSTSGRRSEQLHQYPAFGGWGSGGRDHSFTGLFKPVHCSVRSPGSVRAG